MEFENLMVRREGGIAWVTLNRPTQANALSMALATEFGLLVRDLEADGSCHVVVLQGAGKFFCAGGDVAGMANAADASAFIHDLAGAMHDVLLFLRRSRLVVISAVHGPAAGAGLGLVLNSDLVLASSGASFLSAYAGVGLTPDCGVSYFLPRVVGPRRAAQMCMAGKVVGAEEALDWGLVSEIVEKEHLQERAGELARDLVASAEVLGPTKKLLNPQEPLTYERHLENELESIAAMASSAGTRAKIAKFAERTPA